MRYFVALLLRMTPIYTVSGWSLIIVVSCQMGLEHSEIQLAGSSGQEVVSLSVIRYPLFVIREMSDYE